jgi:hypothetical protein
MSARQIQRELMLPLLQSRVAICKSHLFSIQMIVPLQESSSLPPNSALFGIFVDFCDPTRTDTDA